MSWFAQEEREIAAEEAAAEKAAKEKTTAEKAAGTPPQQVQQTVNKDIPPHERERLAEIAAAKAKTLSVPPHERERQFPVAISELFTERSLWFRGVVCWYRQTLEGSF